MRAVMFEITAAGLDLAKFVFRAHGADVSGRSFLRKDLKGDQVLAFSVSNCPASLPWKHAGEPTSGAAR